MEQKPAAPINILFCGTGGQGVLTAAELCGWAALFDGYHVKKSEVHGMAQRGGSVESHVRFGQQVFSPLIPVGAADFLVSFHDGERERMRHFLKPGGCSIAAVDTRDGLVELRYMNTWLTGILSAKLPLRVESWYAAFEQVLSAKNCAANRAVFDKARNEAR